MSDNNDLMVKKANSALGRIGNVLEGTAEPTDFDAELNAPKRVGLILAGLIFGVFGIWALFAPIDGGAHAQGQVKVRSANKPIQHLEGGIIKSVKVEEGMRVQAGDVIIELDTTQAQSSLGIISTQLKGQLALEARLIAERDSTSTISFPAELSNTDNTATTEIAAQTNLFNARKNTFNGEIALIEQRIGQLQSRITGFKAQKQSKAALARSYQEELKDFQALLEEGFADKIRLRELERNYAFSAGEAAELDATIAATEIQITEAKQEILQLRNRSLSEIVTQLTEVQTNVQDLRERAAGLTDILNRTTVTASESGIINNLKVHTQGTVIGPGMILAEIVPQSDALIIEAKVSPLDVDLIAVGQDATVRMVSLNARKVPTLYGKVLALSPDSIIEQNGTQYYLARIELTQESIANLNGEVLVPGMPADVLISTGSRTFVQYLLKPLSDSVAGSFRED